MAVYYNPSLLTQTTGAPLASVPGQYPLYDLRQKYGLGAPEVTGAFNAYHGLERWFHSTNGSNAGAGGGWFMILPDDTLVAWDGVAGHPGGALVADLSPYGNVYGNTTLLTGASVPTVAGVTFPALIQTGGGSMTLNPAVGFDRSVVVNVTASDGILTTKGSFTFTVNDTAPTETVSNQTIAHNTGADSFNLNATDPGDPSTLTYKVDVSGDNPLYDLQVQYGLNTADIPKYFNAEGAQEKWFLSTNGSNPGAGMATTSCCPTTPCTRGTDGERHRAPGGRLRQPARSTATPTSTPRPACSTPPRHRRPRWYSRSAARCTTCGSSSA